jgi:hypothetical protein
MNHPQRHSRGWRIPGTTVPVMSRGALATSTAETAWGPSVQNTSTRTTKTCCENLGQNCGRFTWLSLNTHWAKRRVMRNATAAVHEGLWSFDPYLSYGRNKWTSPPNPKWCSQAKLCFQQFPHTAFQLLLDQIQNAELPSGYD